MKYKQFLLKSITDAKPGDEENFIIRGVFSTGDPDRQGDKVVQSGWILNEFLTNPVVLFAHDHWQPAVGKIVELGFNDEGNLAGAIQFAAKEYDFAMTLYKLYKGLYMRAFSAGFEALEGGYDEVNDVEVLTKNVLYEISCVNVGAAARALAVQAGIDMSPLEKFMTGQITKRKSYIGKEIDNVNKKINELEGFGYQKEEAEVIAFSVCEKDCSKEKGKCEIKESLARIESAIGTIKVPTAIKKNGRQPSKEGKKILIKTLNKAIRSLLSEKRKLK
jgi:hypothetical protein